MVSVEWSTGGQLAMSLAWTSVSREVRPPEAISTFYCPIDYMDPLWAEPNIPAGSEVPMIRGARSRRGAARARTGTRVPVLGADAREDASRYFDWGLQADQVHSCSSSASLWEIGSTNCMSLGKETQSRTPLGPNG